MIWMLRTVGRALMHRWPALLAWLFAGILGRYLAITLASIVAQWSAYLGALLVALGVLAKLLSLVAMLLVMRDELQALGAIAPTPRDRASRRRFFLDAVMTATVPFLIFYEIWGYLRTDWEEYAQRAIELWLRGSFGAGDEAPAVGALGVSTLTVTTALVAFALTWGWRRFRDRLPRWTQGLAVLTEVLWTYLFVLMIGDVLRAVNSWIQSRAAFAWIGEFRGWLAEVAAPLAWSWTVGEQAVRGVIELVALPVAWIIIAGVVYGVAIEAERRRQKKLRAVDRLTGHWERLPGAVRQGATGLLREATHRLRPMWQALVFSLRAGPVLIGGYVLLFTLTLLLEQLVRGGIIRMVGPQDLQNFWQVADSVLFLLIPLVVEPLRMAIVAGAYDATLERVVDRATVRPSSSVVDGEEEEARAQLGDVDLHGERARVGGDEVGHDELEGRS